LNDFAQSYVIYFLENKRFYLRDLNLFISLKQKFFMKQHAVTFVVVVVAVLAANFIQTKYLSKK